MELKILQFQSLSSPEIMLVQDGASSSSPKSWRFRVQGWVVLPVFYGVDPSEVRNQISGFGEAFRHLIQRKPPTEDQVSRWRIDLREAGGIAGFVVLNSKNESEDIKNIVEHVCNILDKKDMFVANHPVGVDSRLQDLIKISESHSTNDVLLLGLWGMWGIGKTTIAKLVLRTVIKAWLSKRPYDQLYLVLPIYRLVCFYHDPPMY